MKLHLWDTGGAERFRSLANLYYKEAAVAILTYDVTNEQSLESLEYWIEELKTKADNGVNTPRHLVVKRVIEGENDICYVLQQKCPGHNCASLSKYGVSFDEMCDSLKFILNIFYV